MFGFIALSLQLLLFILKAKQQFKLISLSVQVRKTKNEKLISNYTTVEFVEFVIV